MRTMPDPSHTDRPLLRALALALASGLLAAAPVQAADTTAAQQLDRFSTAAGAPGQAERGRVFFTTAHGGEWSCASCHGARPVAPGFNPQAFTDTAKVDKWFRRNCKDVLQRECSAAEKADVLAWLLSLKP